MKLGHTCLTSPDAKAQGSQLFDFTRWIEKVLDRAFDAANGKHVGLGGGPSTVKQYLRANLVDEMNVPIVPAFLGSGKRLFEGDELGGYSVVEVVSSPAVAHFRIERSAR